MRAGEIKQNEGEKEKGIIKIEESETEEKIMDRNEDGNNKMSQE
jgi:hypothetical protein